MKWLLWLLIFVTPLSAERYVSDDPELPLKDKMTENVEKIRTSVDELTQFIEKIYRIVQSYEAIEFTNDSE